MTEENEKRITDNYLYFYGIFKSKSIVGIPIPTIVPSSVPLRVLCGIVSTNSDLVLDVTTSFTNH